MMALLIFVIRVSDINKFNLAVFINLLLGIMLLGVAIYGGITFHPIIYLLFLPVPYFVLKSIKWRTGGFLEEGLRIREELIKLVQPEKGDKLLELGTGGGSLAIGFTKSTKKEDKK